MLLSLFLPPPLPPPSCLCPSICPVSVPPSINRLSVSIYLCDAQSYIDDETSPLYCDPLYSEDYSYSILSKTLAIRKPTTPSQVAAGANQVLRAEGSSTAAQKAVHGGAANRGVGGVARKGTTTMTSSSSPAGGRTKVNGLKEVGGCKQEVPNAQ